jgi:hypothetical protein
MALVGGYAAYSSEEWARAIDTGVGVLQTPAAWLISLALIYAVLANRRPPQDPE